MFAIALLAMVSVSSAWGQDLIDEGYYYLQNKQGNNNGYYLCPALGYYQDDNDKPFLTTFQTGKDNNSLWRIEKVNLDGEDYYRFIHNATGKYITANEAQSGFDAGRFRFHLQTMGQPKFPVHLSKLGKELL